MTQLDGAALRPASRECLALLVADAGLRRLLLRRIGRAHPADTVPLAAEDVLFPQLDVAGNVGLALATAGRDGRERRRQLAELLALAGLDAVAARRPRALTGEQRAATRLARAAGTCRATLLLDHPFEGLDEETRARLLATLRRMAGLRGFGVVFATPERREALAVADRIGVADAGAIRRLDTVASMFASPASAAEAAAIGEANLLTGHVVALEPDDEREAEIRLGCGHVMPARRTDAVPPGGLCLLAVRPDQIAFAAVAAAELGPGALPATLLEHRHLGDHVRLRVRLEDGATLVVRRPASALTPRDLARASLPSGASVAWRAGQATAFPHPEA